MKNYVYFVSYSHRGTVMTNLLLFSNEEIVLDSPIRSIKDVRILESKIFDLTHNLNITVLNYKLVRTEPIKE